LSDTWVFYVIYAKLIIFNRVTFSSGASMRRNRVMITAIHDSDLLKVLKRLGLYEGVVEGRFRCFVCGRRIDFENLGGLFKSRDGEIHFVCNNAKCLAIAAEITSKMRKE